MELGLLAALTMNVGDRVVVTSGPWTGSAGVVLAWPQTARRGPLLSVQLDTGQTIAVREDWVSAE